MTKKDYQPNRQRVLVLGDVFRPVVEKIDNIAAETQSSAVQAGVLGSMADAIPQLPEFVAGEKLVDGRKARGREIAAEAAVRHEQWLRWAESIIAERGKSKWRAARLAREMSTRHGMAQKTVYRVICRHRERLNLPK